MEQPGVCIVPGTTRGTGAGTPQVLGPLQANGLVLIFISAKWGSFDLSDSTLLERVEQPSPRVHYGK